MCTKFENYCPKVVVVGGGYLKEDFAQNISIVFSLQEKWEAFILTAHHGRIFTIL